MINNRLNWVIWAAVRDEEEGAAQGVVPLALSEVVAGSEALWIVAFTRSYSHPICIKYLS